MPLHNPVSYDDELTTIIDTGSEIQTEVFEIETHIHGVGHIYGKDQDGFMIEDGMVSWQLTAGTSGNYGAWLQLDDGTGVTHGVYYDPHRILVTQASVTSKKYYIQFGTGEDGAQEVSGVTEMYPAAALRQATLSVQSRRVLNTDKYWARLACETDEATMSFIIALHPYDE